MNEFEKDKDFTEETESEEAKASETCSEEEKVPCGEDCCGSSETEENKELKQEESEGSEKSESAEEQDGEEKGKPCKEGKEKGHCHRELQKARAEIEKWKAEAEEMKRKWYSVTAEYENYRRRTQNQASQKYTEGRSDVVAALFPVGDNLERALASCADDKTRQGIEMVLKSFRKILESENVEELDPTGQAFDSAVAEAIMAVPAEEGEEAGIVKQVYVKGYKRGDKVLRYAQVIVTQ